MKKHSVRIASLAILAILLVLLFIFRHQTHSFLTNQKQTAHEKELLSMQGYTIQLMGVSRFSALENFVTANQLQSKTYIFYSINKDKDWYSLVYGNYPTREQAQTTKDNFPANLKALYPWIRSMESIHTAILQTKK